MEARNELVLNHFRALVKQDVAVPAAAMDALAGVIKRSDNTTWMQLELELREAIAALKGLTASDLGGRTAISLGSGCDLFMKYVSRAFLEYTEFRVCKEELVRRGEHLALMSANSRHMIAEYGNSFVRDGCTVLVHGMSRVVAHLLLNAAKTKQFSIVLTECRPQNDGAAMAKIFADAKIPTSIVLDSAVGSLMERTDMVLCGAEGVMENGGIVNKLGTYQVAMIAKALRKPFYVAVESYKFARMYPLGQRDVEDMATVKQSIDSATGPSWEAGGEYSDLMVGGLTKLFPHASVDFTPAKYITLLFTDLGVLTPAAVSDELIRLYQ